MSVIVAALLELDLAFLAMLPPASPRTRSRLRTEVLLSHGYAGSSGTINKYVHTLNVN